MTESKALEIIDDPTSKRNHQDLVDTLLIAKAAIKKQIPMKVKEIHVDEYICPNCLDENTGCDQGLISDQYCPKCGQKLYSGNCVERR